MDLGAVSMMIYGWREREEVLRFLEKITGLRMNHNFIRPGGVAADLPDGWRDDVLRLLDLRRAAARASTTTLLTEQPDLARAPVRASACITTEEALALGATGPILRSTGVRLGPAPGRSRTSHYDEVDFDVIVGELRRLLRPLRDPPRRDPRVDEDRPPDPSTRMPAGDYRIQDKKVTPPPRARIDESMEALIHHFKIFTEGFKVPDGRDLRRDRVARAARSAATSCQRRLGASPYRMHIRGPSFVQPPVACRT